MSIKELREPDEAQKVNVKYKLDESSVQTVQKLDVKNFRESLLREVDMLLSHKIKAVRSR